MSTLIQAKLVKKQWLNWARERLEKKPHIEVPAVDISLKILRELRVRHRQSLSYEVSDVTAANASMAILYGLDRLGIELTIGVVGDPLEPALLQLTKHDIEPILKESSLIEKTIAFSPSAMDGMLVVDMPMVRFPSKLLVSCCGSLEKLVPYIRAKLPGGSTFRS